MEKLPAQPLDVTVVAGYNDLVEGHTVDQILEKLNNLSVMVLDAESGSEKNTIAFSSFMYPPKLAWYSDNGRIPYERYVNQMEKIDDLNFEVRVLNGQNAVKKYPGFHT